GRTLLHRTCTEGKVDKIASLLKQGANTNIRDNEGWTPLHEAARHGHVEIAELLVQHGADHGAHANSKGADQDTPLHDATENGHEDVAVHLLSFGADPEARNANGATPLDI
ncbi:ankyrin repeat-containing domain protein, partial [Syncephalastrum racemosum]